QVYCTAGERTDTLRASLAAMRGEYPVERLTVAPTFGREPDSALAARIRRESDRATAVAVASHDTASVVETVSPPARLAHNERLRARAGVQRHHHVAPH